VTTAPHSHDIAEDLADFTATPDTAKELDRQLGLNEVVLRTKVLRADA